MVYSVDATQRNATTETPTMYTLNKAEARALVAFCSRDVARYTLTRAAFDNGAIVATDGHRLLKCDVHRDHDAPSAPLWTVPRHALDAARKAAKAKDAIQIQRVPATDQMGRRGRRRLQVYRT